MSFTFLEVKEGDLLKQVYAFRYKILSEIYPEYLKISNLYDNEEHDKYDPYAVHFAAIDDNNQVCATLRLIYNSPIGYPTENSMDFNKESFSRDKLAEMSRIFVDAKYRDLKTTKIIIEGAKKFMYSKMKELGIEYSYGSLEKAFLRLLKIYKVHYHTLAEQQLHDLFGFRYPCVLYTQQLGEDNPELIRYWEKRHVM